LRFFERNEQRFDLGWKGEGGGGFMNSINPHGENVFKEMSNFRMVEGALSTELVQLAEYCAIK